MVNFSEVIKKFFRKLDNHSKSIVVSFPKNSEIINAEETKMRTTTLMSYILPIIEEQFLVSIKMKHPTLKKVNKGVTGGIIKIYEDTDIEHILRDKHPLERVGDCGSVVPCKTKYVFGNRAIHEEYKSRMGNLTLLNSSLNRSKNTAGDSCPKCKFPQYNHTSQKYEITKNIPTTYPSWDKGDINNRTKWLLDIINVLWPEIDKIKI